jgi:hypothetical protein
MTSRRWAIMITMGTILMLSIRFHFVVPLAVGTGPIPTQQVFVFSKP